MNRTPALTEMLKILDNNSPKAENFTDHFLLFTGEIAGDFRLLQNMDNILYLLCKIYLYQYRGNDKAQIAFFIKLSNSTIILLPRNLHKIMELV